MSILFGSMNDEQKKYEIGFLAKSENGGQEVVKVLNGCGAAVFDNGNVSKIKLSYPILKESHAYFGYLRFSADAGEIEKMSKNLKLNSDILRFLIISVSGKEILKAQPSKTKKASPVSKIAVKTSVQKQAPEIISNELLEKKLEEILK